jgi:hypothetical protein
MSILDKAKSWKSERDKQKAEEKAVYNSAYSDVKQDIIAQKRQEKLQRIYEKGQKRAELRYRFGEKVGSAVKGGISNVAGSVKNQMLIMKAKAAEKRAAQPKRRGITGMNITNPNVDYGFGSMGSTNFNVLGSGNKRRKTQEFNFGLGGTSLSSKRRKNIRWF